MRELTGRHVLAITCGAFGVIIAVNLVMAWKAVSTFPGVEVASSYAAGVGFDARRAAQVALLDRSKTFRASLVSVGRVRT